MEFKLDSTAEAFRAEVREFIQANMPAGWLPRPYIFINEAEWHVARKFDRRLGERGWLTPGWSRELGGLEMGLVEQLVLDEELALAGAPDGGGRGHGPHFVGPAVLHFGTEEQIARYIPAIVDGSEIWAQCFSEDTAGSDMANVQSTAVREGDDYILTGTKIWTGQGHRAERAIVTARTGDGPKHRSLSLFVVDLRSEGVDIRPLWTLPEHGRLNLETFDHVRVPVSNRLGGENEAWSIMLDVMNHERGGVGGPAASRRILESFLRAVRNAPPDSHLARTKARWRLAAADLFVQIEIARLLNYRIVWLRTMGKMPDYESSIAKVMGASISQRLGDLLVQAYGLEGQLAAPNNPTGDSGDWFTDLWLQAQMAGIVSGTTEIMKNVIATRGLGLPRG